MRRGVLLVISGPSGCGKNSILQGVRALDPTIGYSVSCTTRKPRKGEEEGIDYYFVSSEKFDEMIDSGEIVEWDQFVNNKYGTPKTPLLKAVAEGKDIMFDITIPGAMKLKEFMPEDTVTVFLLPPSLDELRRRLVERGTETEEQINARLAKASGEISQADKFEYQVVNDNMEECVARIYKILCDRRDKVNNL